MTEYNYRIHCLEQRLKDDKNKIIAIYGIGNNAKAILDCLTEHHIVGLIDSQMTGKYIWGKKLLNQLEILELKVDTIIMAAELDSSEYIYQRFAEFCYDHNINLLNIYGLPEINLRKKLAREEADYPISNEFLLEKEISMHNAICFQIKDVLLNVNIGKAEDFLGVVWEKSASQINKEDFIIKRIAAENSLKKRGIYTIRDVYDRLAAFGGKYQEECPVLYESEWKAFQDRIASRRIMITICNKTMDSRTVYLVSDLNYEEKAVRFLLHAAGLQDNYYLLNEAEALVKYQKGLLRNICEKLEDHSLLLIGTKNRLMLPLIYNQDIFLIKSSLELMQSSPAFALSKEIMEATTVNTEALDKISERWNSPFLGGTGSGGHPNIRRKHRIIVPPSEKPVVSIVIPVYEQFEMTCNCVETIVCNTDEGLYEIIIADDQSEGPVRELDKTVVGAKIIHNKENMGFLKNCNNAVGYAAGKYLVFLNNDTLVQKDWLPPMLSLMENNHDIGLVGSKLLNSDGTLQEAGNIVWQDGSITCYGRGDLAAEAPWYQYVRDVDYITGASIMIRMSLWKEIGGFDCRYIPAYYEDNDLAFEVRKRGYRVCYQPFSRVIHLEGMTHGRDVNSGIKSYQIINEEKFRDKWKTFLLKQHFPYELNYQEALDRRLAGCKAVLLIIDTITARIFEVINKYLSEGRSVKVVLINCAYNVEVSTLQQMGVEVLYGKYVQEYFDIWLSGYDNLFEYALYSCDDIDNQVLNSLRRSGITYSCLEEMKE